MHNKQAATVNFKITCKSHTVAPRKTDIDKKPSDPLALSELQDNGSTSMKTKLGEIWYLNNRVFLAVNIISQRRQLN